MKTHPIILLLVMMTIRGAGADDTAMAGREAQLAASALAKQNEGLKAEIARLREEVAKMTLQLAQAKAEIDRLALTGASIERGNAARVETWTVTDVNPDLKLTVVDAGRSGGVKPGMNLTVLRGDKAVARLRVVDVRERISGAVIEETLEAGGPAKGDRAVLSTRPQ